MEAVSVTKLVSCPDFEAKEQIKPYVEVGKYIHDAFCKAMKKKYPDGECEYKVETEINGVKVVGKLDYIRFDEPIFYELKPFKTTKPPVEWLLQMWLYEYILRRQTNRYYIGYWVYYSRKSMKWWIVFPLVHNDNFIEPIEALIKFRLENPRGRIGGYMCSLCTRNRACKPRFLFDKYKGVRSVGEED